MERLGDFLLKHIAGIAAYCDHQVRFGVVHLFVPHAARAGRIREHPIKAVVLELRALRPRTVFQCRSNNKGLPAQGLNQPIKKSTTPGRVLYVRSRSSCSRST